MASSLTLMGEEGKTAVSEFIYMLLKFGLVMVLLVINLTAVSIALLCNKNDSIISKIMIATFAFLFGIIYIFFNYYTYRILMKRETCVYSGRVFPF
jgi:hypothetical protein